MGAVNFYCEAEGKTLSEAFRSAVDEAYYEYGHRGYTGTIAEKSGVTLIDIPLNALPDTGNERGIGERVASAFAYFIEDDSLSAPAEYEWAVLAKADAIALRDAIGAREFERMAEIWDEKWGNALAFRLAENKFAFCGMASC
jgi:hypothetical protein